MRALAAIAATAVALSWGARSARADDEVVAHTTWFQEPREGPKGLTVIHPQFAFGVDIGEAVSFGMGYSADIVSGATPAVFSVDAVSSATEFSDTRHTGSATLGFAGRRASLNVTGGIGGERDYLSRSVSVSSTIDLPGKNTQLALSYSHAFDEVCDKENADANGAFERRPLTADTCAKKNGLFGVDNPEVDGRIIDTVWRDLAIDTAQGTLTQNLSPTVVAQFSLFGQILEGFQSNPYRRVRVRQFEAQESVPDVRARLAVAARMNKYLVGPRAAVSFGARGYADTWGVEALSVEMAYKQYFGDSLLLRVRSRLYQQTQAKFFKDAFFYETQGSAGSYFTGDRELAPIRNVLTGAKLSYVAAGKDGREVWGLFDEILFDVKADVMFYKELEAESPGPNPVGIDRQYITSTGLIDAIVLSLGLRMSY